MKNKAGGDTKKKVSRGLLKKVEKDTKISFTIKEGEISHIKGYFKITSEKLSKAVSNS